MTSEPAAPGAGAIILYRQEVADDRLHMHSVYVRMKILTEEGKKYADVEIPYEQRNFGITSVGGRTIHADGTIVPFTGKPYEKLLQRTATRRYQAKVFTIPDAQVGSILEYRYELRYEDRILLPPTWYIQGDVFLRKAEYRYVPMEESSNRIITTGRNQTASALIWYPILPKGAEIKHTQIPVSGTTGSINHYDLEVTGIPAEPVEEFTPPLHSLSYRVYFLYSPYGNPDEFWKKEGKYWSSESNKFIGPGPAVAAAVSKITSPGDAPDVKLQKIYAEVMSYENTEFTRERSRTEDKAEGLREIKSTGDLVAIRRGSGEELTMLFIAMARAAGLKAYYMQGTAREDEIFNRNRLTMDQLDSPIAIVNVGGKDQYFDPGERYCAYGHLRWDHTQIGGIRQMDDGTAFAQTPVEKYDAAKTIRIANLTLSETGEADGIVQLGLTGDPALYWRQLALRRDQTEVEKDMEDSLREDLPGGLTVKLEKIWSLADSSKQLVARFHVDGPLANVTAKRLFVPLEIFEVNEKPMFSQPKRETPIYFHYGHLDVDEIHLTYPASVEVETVPKPDEIKMQTFAMLRVGSESKANTVTLTRNFGVASIIFMTTDYDELRNFYGKVDRKDQEQLVLKVASHVAGN